MTDKKNIVASVLARLRNTAKSSGAPFQQILQQYGIERFLYRVSKSQHAQTVVLKGALLLKTIGQCQQSDEGLLRRVDLLAAPRSRQGRTSEGHRRYVRESRNTSTRGRRDSHQASLMAIRLRGMHL